MKITMIEIEYKRAGKVEILTYEEDDVGVPTGEFLSLSGYIRRARRRPHAMNRLIEECLSRHCIITGRRFNTGEAIQLRLPPATIIRQRTITIERGEWEAVNSDPDGK